MATTTTKPDMEMTDSLRGVGVSAWPPENRGAAGENSADDPADKPSQHDALQALLAFSALHEQVRRRKALAASQATFDSKAPAPEFEPSEQFVLDEVLQLVAERAVAITGADGLAIALAEHNEIVLRAAAGSIRPDLGARIDRDSAFSGACFRTAQIVNCDDTELDSRVNLEACRKLGARSMVAVPLCGKRRVIGVLEAFSSWPFGFNDSDVRNLSLLAELVLAALKPEDEDRFAQSAQVAATKLEPAKVPSAAPAPVAPLPTAMATPAPAVAPAPTSAAQPPTPLKPAPALSTSTPRSVAAPTPAAPAKETAPVTSGKAAIPVVEPKPAEKAPAASATPVPNTQKTSTAAPVSSPKPTVAAPEAGTQKPEAETKVEAAVAPGQPEPEQLTQRGWILVVLVCIVVATAFAAGVWWKLKSQQIGSEMVRTQPAVVQQPVNVPAAVPPVAQNLATANNDDENSAADEPQAPATPGELSKFPRVTGVRHWSSADTSTVVLDLEDQVQYEPGHLSNPERFYFDLRDTQLVPELKGKSLDGDALLSKIRVAQPVAGMTRIVLEARPGAALSQPQVSLERDPYRLVIQVVKAGAHPKSSVNLFPNAPEAQKNKLAIVVPPPTKEDLQLRPRVPHLRIVVDAGHGGWDLGTVGRRGLLEKDVVLEISERLGKLLESRIGADVIYTRRDDNYIPLDERAMIANQAQADLFVSVHANYSDLPSARGVETYYTNFFSAPGSKDLGPKGMAAYGGALSNANSVAGSLTNAVAPTLSSADLHERIEQSRRLAASVQRSLYGTLSAQNSGLRDRGVREAAFVVLTESAMPGILAEVSFVSSPTDEQKLRSDGYREQIAEALYRGIARYAVNSKGVKLASASK
ncbi:MAG TPA: N-acetylmuramoyl-L-alanine amidase [Candidatus Sulfotelmatobacter sp.]|nr:N-acetylmuramoyl-L-alanine amidase [Candidatus Sulfotelmatobacter sp.]